MRGKLTAAQTELTSMRNIPAYAGKTHRTATKAPDCWEHPRVCGENTGPKATATRHLGTSPRMRGKRNSIFPPGPIPWNIPAYAGKTSREAWLFSTLAEHPRVCGENHTSGHHCQCGPGTSPRMRGKLVSSHDSVVLVRNIPACAGKTH